MVNNHFPYFFFIMNVIVNFLINFHLPYWDRTAKALGETKPKISLYSFIWGKEMILFVLAVYLILFPYL